MTDDWSLKGKEKHWYDGIIYDYKINERAISFYFSEDIETLRRELIDDFLEWLDDIGHKLSNDCSLEFAKKSKSFVRQINRRFGVEVEK